MSQMSLTRPLTIAAGIAALSAAAVLGFVSPALAHDELIGTDLITDESGTATGVELNFNNSIVEVGTEFIVHSANGDDVTDGPAKISGPTVTQGFAAELEPGDYQAAWRVVSSDGHPIDGAFAIEVASDGSALIAEAMPISEDPNTGSNDEVAVETTGDNSSSTPVSLIVVLSVGAVVVLAGTVAAVSGRKRRTQAMSADAPLDTGK